MSNPPDLARRLRQHFGGSWDGAHPEIHGLVSLDGQTFKIELLFSRRRNTWQCSVFSAGACLASTSGSDPIDAVEEAGVLGRHPEE